MNVKNKASLGTNLLNLCLEAGVSGFVLGWKQSQHLICPECVIQEQMSNTMPRCALKKLSRDLWPTATFSKKQTGFQDARLRKLQNPHLSPVSTFSLHIHACCRWIGMSPARSERTLWWNQLTAGDRLLNSIMEKAELHKCGRSLVYDKVNIDMNTIWYDMSHKLYEKTSMKKLAGS